MPQDAVLICPLCVFSSQLALHEISRFSVNDQFRGQLTNREPQGMFNYVEFCDDVDSAFATKGLEKVASCTIVGLSEQTVKGLKEMIAKRSCIVCVCVRSQMNKHMRSLLLGDI